MAKKFNQYRQWFISVSAIAIIFIGTIILVAVAQGFTYDISSHKFTKTGLVLIDSQPNNATVTLNDTKINKHTPYRYANAPVGPLTITLTKPDYREWSSKTSVTAGEVTFVDYALLLPTILYQEQTTQTQLYSSVLQSEDQDRTIATLKDQIGIVSLSSNTQPKIVYQPNVNIPTVTALVVTSLSYDGDKILTQQTMIDNSKRTIVIDASSGKQDDLTSDFGRVFTGLQFNKRNASELYWLDNGVVKKIDLNNKTLSSPILNSVQSLNVVRDRLLAIVSTEDTSQLQLVSTNLDGNDKKNISQLSINKSGYQASYIHSRFAEYVTILNNDNGNMQLLKNPYANENNPEEKRNLGDNVKSFTVSANGRFLVLNQNAHMRTLDLEFNEDLQYNTSLDNIQAWSWYDDYHLGIQLANRIYISDYDGQNMQLLTPIPDINSYSIVQKDKAFFVLNTTGNLYKLYLTKK